MTRRNRRGTTEEPGKEPENGSSEDSGVPRDPHSRKGVGLGTTPPGTDETDDDLDWTTWTIDDLPY